MTFTVFGTGAVGAYYGARLADLGHRVNFLARSDYKTIKEKGLTVLSPRGDIHLDSPDVYNTPSDIPPADVVLVALKTTGNRDLKEQIAPLVHKGTALLVLQNGLGMEEEFRSWFPENPVIGGMCFICSRKQGPGIIEHQDKGAITLGSLDRKDDGLRDEIGAQFEEASIPVTLIDELHEARWRKLLWNIPFNGLSVALDSNTGEIMSTPSSVDMVRMLMKEVLEGAAACGCAIEVEAMEKMLEFTKIMTPYEPSMKLDYLANRPMEIEYMYDRPIAEAAAAGYEMRATKMLRDQLSFIQKRYMEKAD
jgi:2-dehydropantoate 2-reductase